MADIVVTIECDEDKDKLIEVLERVLNEVSQVRRIGWQFFKEGK